MLQNPNFFVLDPAGGAYSPPDSLGDGEGLAAPPPSLSGRFSGSNPLQSWQPH